jgi:hypothetical protein
MTEDVRRRIAKAHVDFGRLKGAWSSDVRLGAKVQYLQTKVLAGLLYGCEAANHSAVDMRRLEAFQRYCWRRLTQRVVVRHGAKLRRNRSQLQHLLTTLGRRRLAFASQLVARPGCELARRMLFAEVVTPTSRRTKSLATRSRTAYHNVLGRDLAELAKSGWAKPTSLTQLIEAGREKGRARVVALLKARRQASGVLAADERQACPSGSCHYKCRTGKAMTRHIKSVHQDQTGTLLRGQLVWTSRRPARVPQPGQFRCSEPGCTRSYRTAGWLRRHIASMHDAGQ